MARRNRASRQEMNFDGLADSVTNLVGALILVVVLVMGVTEEAVSQAPAPEPVPQGNPRSILPLQQRLATLQAQMEQVQQSAKALNGQLDSLRTEADELFKKVDQLQPPPPEKSLPENSAKAQPREVKFRPPFERADDKEQIIFWVQDQRLTFLEGPASLEKDILGLAGKKTGKIRVSQLGFTNNAFVINGTAVIEKGEKGMVSVDMNHPDSMLDMVRRPDAPADGLADLPGETSAYFKKLKSLDPKTHSVQFMVYPDSFEAYRAARARAWEQGFDVGWQPMTPGKAFSVATGGARVN